MTHKHDPHPQASEPDSAARVMAPRAVGAVSVAHLRGRSGPTQARAVIQLQKSVGNRALARSLVPTRTLAREPPPLAQDASAPNTAVHGTPFVQGAGDTSDIDANDVRQGLVGDCNLLAAAAAIARAKPDAIRRLIRFNPDGSYDVTLYYSDGCGSGNLTPHTFRVTSQFYMDAHGAPVYAGYGDSGAGGQELWVMLLEKALARYKGSYTAAGGALWDREALELLTGNSAHELDTDFHTEDIVLRLISVRLAARKAITANTSASGWTRFWRTAAEQREMDALHIVREHAYSIESVDTARRTLNLRNPWGYNHLTNLPVAAFREYFNSWSWIDVP